MLRELINQYMKTYVVDRKLGKEYVEKDKLGHMMDKGEMKALRSSRAHIRMLQSSPPFNYLLPFSFGRSTSLHWAL